MLLSLKLLKELFYFCTTIQTLLSFSTAYNIKWLNDNSKMDLYFDIEKAKVCYFSSLTKLGHGKWNVQKADYFSDACDKKYPMFFSLWNLQKSVKILSNN